MDVMELELFNIHVMKYSFIFSILLSLCAACSNEPANTNRFDTVSSIDTVYAAKGTKILSTSRTHVGGVSYSTRLRLKNESIDTIRIYTVDHKLDKSGIYSTSFVYSTLDAVIIEQ